MAKQDSQTVMGVLDKRRQSADKRAGEQREPRPVEIVHASDADEIGSLRTPKSIAVVVPCFRVADHLAGVLSAIGPEVSSIYCVIDGCEDGSQAVAEEAARTDARIQIIHHETNLGVGAACISGYAAAIAQRADIIVKLDGDGQMSPAEIPYLIKPLLDGKADYAKGNRFASLEDTYGMPWVRLLGNAGLSFFSKLSTGYWNVFDPTNGFTAMTSATAKEVPWQKLHAGYFFESDLLFRLYLARAVVRDRPMKARYGIEKSNLSVLGALVQFPVLHLRNFAKRLGYSYFLRDFNMASLNLVIGLILLGFGATFGIWQWWRSIEAQALASSGTVMLAALPCILGWQAILSFLSYDVGNVPTRPISDD